MNIYITKKLDAKDEKNAGAKAPKDIYSLNKKMGWKEIELKMPCPENGKIKYMINSFFSYILQWHKVPHENIESILYQYPMYLGMIGTLVTKKMIQKFNKKYHIPTIILINDLEYLRYKEDIKRSEQHKQRLLKMDLMLIQAATVTICHNNSMKKFLIEKGIDEKKIVVLSIFDYLCEKNKKEEKNIEADIAIAGNLKKNKSAYIYKLAEANPKVKINVYGVGFEKQSKLKNLNYKGSYTPEKLPNELNAKFGIVWDGTEITSCTGTFGQYLKYNNPHKFSLYMASGIPVITWKQAAIAEFIKDNNVGILVDDLCDISSVLDSISEAEYEEMRENTKKIRDKVTKGFYYCNAIQKSIKICKDKY